MTTAFWCILGAGPASAVGRYDNRNPHGYLAGQTGVSLRANAAQLNVFEAFAPFAAGVIVAHLVNSPQATIDGLAVAFVVARALHGLAYIFDQSTLRSLLWFVALGCVIALFVVSA